MIAFRHLLSREFPADRRSISVSGKVHLLGERISPADPLQLRIQRLLQLPGEEGHEDENERGDGEPFSPTDESAAPSLGDHALEGERHEQHEPDVTGCAEFVIRKAEREEREQRRAEAPQTEDGEGEDEEERNKVEDEVERELRLNMRRGEN